MEGGGPPIIINKYGAGPGFADLVWGIQKKGADTQTLSAEIFENCGNFLIVEDWLLLLWNKTYELWKFLIKY